MKIPNIIKNKSNDKSQPLNSLIQNFDATVHLTRKVWVSLSDKVMKKELLKQDYYDTPSDFFNDLIVDYGHENIKGFKIDIGDCCSEQVTNIEYCDCSYDAGYDSFSKTHSCRGLQFFALNGTDIPQIQDIDLSKFYHRIQIEEVDIKNISKPRLPTKFLFDDLRDIDTELLTNWIRHQLMLTMFNCTYDPFYMEGEQFQQENQGYTPNEPTYDIPEGFHTEVTRIIIKGTSFNLIK
jgi:hypothetical protein